MLALPGNRSVEGAFLAPLDVERPSRPSGLEAEVEQFFDQLRNPLLRYLLSFGLPSQDAEEVVQEVFLALFQHLRLGKSRSNLRGWIFRVAHNQGLKRYQANRKDETVIRRGSEGVAEKKLDTAPDPEEAIANRQRQQHLLAVVRALPEQDRRCLYLRAEGLRYREIRDVLGISLGSVALSIQRALARLIHADGG